MSASQVHCIPRIECLLAFLPTEILEIIVDYIGQTSLSSLYALGCTSKFFSARTSAFLYHTVHIRLEHESQDEISSRSKQITRKLQRNNALSMVRCLIIERQRLDGTDQSHPSTPMKDTNALRQHILELQSPKPGHRTRYLKWTREQDTKWLQVAALIRMLPSLTDLLYGGSNQFAPCLLKTLHESRPTCRLWLNTFRLHSIWGTRIDPTELALVSSPCLYSIRSDGFGSWEGGIRHHSMYDEEAICRIVAGIAPHIQEVHVMSYYGRQPADSQPRKQWTPFFHEICDDQPKKGSLRIPYRSRN